MPEPGRTERAQQETLCEGNRTYFNYYLLLLVFFQYGVLLPNLAAYLLVTIHNANDIRFMEMDWDALGNAFGSFFGKGLRIPQFYWAEYFGNFDTILGHMALAFGIDLFLIVQSVLPQAGSTFDLGVAARV